MQVFAVLFLAAVALARPQTSYNNGAVTTVTERTFTIRGDGNAAADKYFSSGSSSGSSSSGVSSYSNGASGVSSYSAAPAQQSYYQQYEAAAPAVAYQAASYQAAAPVYAYQAAAPAVAYQAAAYQAPAVAYQAAAPAYAYQAASYQAAAPAYAYQAAAPAVAYQAAAYQAPAVAYQAVTAAPAVAYQAVTAAPAVSYKAVAAAPAYKAAVSQRVESNYENNYNNNYESSVDQSQYAAGETKVFKHVYAFAAPEEPATRARISVQAPISKRKHYKLVFIKTPSQQTIVDSDITLPAQEEEKTLIYLLSKDRKQVQPEIRIKQAEASKHAKPEVFFLKYKNEQEAQAIASGAISGQTADVPANGEIISDGSVSILGQSGGQSSFGGSSFDSSFRSGAANSGASNVVYRGGFASGNSGFSAGNSGFSAGNSGFSAGNSGFASGNSGFASGDVSPATTYTSGSRTGFSFGTGSSGSASSGSAYSGSAGLSGGFSAYSQDPASVALQASESFESSTAGAL